MDQCIIVDTREQKPLWNKGIEKKTLKTGDYSIKGHEETFAIERKSIQDLFGTLGKGHTRFKKELTRAQTLEYFAIVIEGSIEQIIKKEFTGSHHTRMKGYVILKILSTLSVKYGIPVFFCGNRTYTKHMIRELCNSYIKKQ